MQNGCQNSSFPTGSPEVSIPVNLKPEEKKECKCEKEVLKTLEHAKKIHGLAFRKTHITKFPEASGKTKI